MVRAKRLRALHRLLDYALAECQELGLPHLERLLGAAALAIDDAIASDGAKPAVPRGPRIGLAVGADNSASKARRADLRT